MEIQDISGDGFVSGIVVFFGSGIIGGRMGSEFIILFSLLFPICLSAFLLEQFHVTSTLSFSGGAVELSDLDFFSGCVVSPTFFHPLLNHRLNPDVHETHIIYVSLISLDLIIVLSNEKNM